MAVSGALLVNMGAFGLTGSTTGGLDDQACAMMDGLSLYRWGSPATRQWWNTQCMTFTAQSDRAWFWRSLWSLKLEVFGLGINVPADKTNFAHYPWSLDDGEFVAAYKSVNDGKDPGLGDGDLRLAKTLGRIGKVAGAAGAVISFAGLPEVGGPLKVAGSVAGGGATVIPWLHDLANKGNVAALKGRYEADARRRSSVFS